MIIDDDALSLTPNCQTTGPPLLFCTNHPYACGSGWPLASLGGVSASARHSARIITPFFSARSNCSRSRTVEIMPDAGVSDDATYEDAVGRPRASTAYGVA